MSLLPLLRWLILTTVAIASLFLSAGRWDLPVVWIYVSLYSIFNLAISFTADPQLIKERLAPAAGGRDHLLRFVALPILVIHWVLAGLDIGRFHWSTDVAPAVRITGLVGTTIWLGLVWFAMSVNRFFSSVVRIQRDRSHCLITHGPYRFVRHPGYLGMVIGHVCSGPALGSWICMVPSLAGILMVVHRTAVEDQFLLHSLEGYAAYADKVRYRLVPGLW